MSQEATIQVIKQRLAQEVGTRFGSGRRRVALVYPSPYSVGMSSLGFQTIYRLLNDMHDTVCERAFLDDAYAQTIPDGALPMLLSYEHQRPVGDFGVVAFSVSYELEIMGVFTCLKQAGVPLLSSERGHSHPWVVMGGPLTFSNPLPLAPFADVIPMGEAEDLLPIMMDALFSGESKDNILKSLAAIPGFYIPIADQRHWWPRHDVA